MNLPLNGAALVGANESVGGETFEALDARSGAPLGPAFHESTAAEVEAAARLAEEAQIAFAETAPAARAALLEDIGARILAIGDALIERATSETALPRARLEGERARTVGQLAALARHVREGEPFDVTIDRALPDRKPLPRPDLRRRHVAVGPVAVFGASNFPLAFSVAGGDTASALAAGCPVIVKGHPAHPGTGELVARAIGAAVRAAGLPAGVFSYLPGRGNALGAALVADPRIKAVGFTGSRAGGLALMRIAAARPEPIPVYAEMSSVNPVFLFPGAAARNGPALAKAFVASLTLGAGQFCTNPGLLIGVRGESLDAFIAAAAEALKDVAPSPMLTPAIADGYARGVRSLHAVAGVEVIARGKDDPVAHGCRASLARVDADRLAAEPRLTEEVFGASALVVRAASAADFAALAAKLEGQLTATVLHEPEDAAAVAALLPVLERRAGRLIGNGWPTGVEVAPAMVHGGPFPATSDGRSSSVGTLAIERFLRPVCYQDLPDALLPAAVREANPWGLPRHVDGAPERR